MEFIVEGPPQGKARPRFSRKSQTVYTPSKTAAYEKEIANAYRRADGKLFKKGCYLAVSVEAYFTVPKSFSKVKVGQAVSGDLRPDKKPDVDNILKAVLDGLNGTAYEDDSQVVSAKCIKWYDSSHSEGHIVVNVYQVQE